MLRAVTSQRLTSWPMVSYNWHSHSMLRNIYLCLILFLPIHSLLHSGNDRKEDFDSSRKRQHLQRSQLWSSRVVDSFNEFLPSWWVQDWLPLWVNISFIMSWLGEMLLFCNDRKIWRKGSRHWRSKITICWSFNFWLAEDLFDGAISGVAVFLGDLSDLYNKF